MPIYQYLCQKCDASFEDIQFGSSSKKPNCPKCGAKKVEKKLSAFSITGNATLEWAPSSCDDTGCHSPYAPDDKKLNAKKSKNDDCDHCP